MRNQHQSSIEPDRELFDISGRKIGSRIEGESRRELREGQATDKLFAQFVVELDLF